MSSRKAKPATKRPAKGKTKLPGPASTEKARKAAIAEIQARLEGKQRGAKEKSVKAKARPARKPGGLTAAYQVLRGAKEPMRCADIVGESIKRGLWSSSGKTPSATIHAAMIREIAAKGKESRFRKVGRGLFAAAKGE